MHAIYPGTFDPLTLGHMDIITRAVALFETVTVAVAAHGKKHCLFNVEERCQLAREALADLGDAINIMPFSNLTVDTARERGAHVIIRGLRASSDFEYEFTMAKFFDDQASEIEVVYLMADAHKLHISSSMVKEIASLRGDVSSYVTPFIAQALERKYKEYERIPA